MNTTAKVALHTKTETGVGEHRQVVLDFTANYADGKNNAWSLYTPSLQLKMAVKGAVADQFRIGGEYTITFTEDKPEPVTAAAEPEPVAADPAEA